MRRSRKKTSIDGLKWSDFDGGGLVGSKKSVTCPVSGVTKGFACNTPQSSRRHVNVHVHSQYLRKVIQFRNNSRKVFFGDSGDAGILASRFLIKILKSCKKQNKALFIKIGGGGGVMFI